MDKLILRACWNFFMGDWQRSWQYPVQVSSNGVFPKCSLNSGNSVTKIIVMTVKGLEPDTSCVRDQYATRAPARHMWKTGSLYWTQFMLQWFIRFSAPFRKNSNVQFLIGTTPDWIFCSESLFHSRQCIYVCVTSVFRMYGIWSFIAEYQKEGLTLDILMDKEGTQSTHCGFKQLHYQHCISLKENYFNSFSCNCVLWNLALVLYMYENRFQGFKTMIKKNILFGNVYLLERF